MLFTIKINLRGHTHLKIDFFVAFSETETIEKYVLKISLRKTLIKVIKISPVPLDRFCSNLQGLCEKVLSSERGELFFKIVLLLFTNN